MPKEKKLTDKQAIFDEMKEFIIQGEKDKAKELATSHIEEIDPVELIENGLAPAMVVVGLPEEVYPCRMKTEKQIINLLFYSARRSALA